MISRIAVVIGGSGGIGSAICQRLAEAGAQVVVTYHSNEARAQQIAEELPGQGHLVRRAPVDDTPALNELATEISRVWGRIDILVNAAGTTRFVPCDNLDTLDDSLIDEIFRVNWRGVFAPIRAFRRLLEAGGEGLVVNISSSAATMAIGSNVAYCASKAAVNNLTISLARALAPRIRVVAVAPGVVDTEFIQGLDPVWRENQLGRTPLERFATPKDVASRLLSRERPPLPYRLCHSGRRGSDDQLVATDPVSPLFRVGSGAKSHRNPSAR